MDRILVRDAPAIPGLRFRSFRSEADYPAIVAVIKGSKDVDGIERVDSVEEVARKFQHLSNCDPHWDMLFVEVEGQVVGFGQVSWWEETEGTRLYGHSASLLPEWRGKGIRRAMVRHNERRLREVAATHPADVPQFFEAWARDTETHWESLLLGEGYEAARHRFGMIRPNLCDIPDLPMPKSLEIRPVQAEHIRPIWNAAKEAFRDAPGYAEDNWSDARFELWTADPTSRPELWQVAWDRQEIAGMVLNYIIDEENQEYERRRGYASVICTRRPWRRRGLAKALLACSFRVLKEHGMNEAGLNVEAENPTGAIQLYRGMGFQVARRTTVYHKPLAGVQGGE